MIDRMLAKLKRLLGGALLLLSPCLSHALDIANLPLFVPTALAPNIVVTLDDSGSMAWGFVPDICGPAWHGSLNVTGTSNDCTNPNTLHSRRFKSAHFNPLYYNPATTYPAPVQADNTPLSTSFSSARINGFNAGSASIDLNTAYRPTAAYDPSKTLLSEQVFANHPSNDATDPDDGNFTNQTGDAAAYYFLFDTTRTNTSGQTCNPSGKTDLQQAADNNDDACYKYILVGGPNDTFAGTSAEQKQNFANWYSFYRTRNLATVSAATRGFSSVAESVRVAWQALNACDSLSGNCESWQANSSFDNRINTFSGNHRTNFYSWIQKLPAFGNTPLRTAMKRAGEYFKTSGANSPYDNKINDSSDNTEYACRPNFHVLLTDGMWNDADTDVTLPDSKPSNLDNNTITLPASADLTLYSPQSYSPHSPYSDSNSLSLADIAMYYWATDLRGNLENRMIPYTVDRSGTDAQKFWNPKNNPATWQHMVNYTVGMGLSESLSKRKLVWNDTTDTPPTYSGSYDGLRNGSLIWPNANTNADNTTADPNPNNDWKVADLWHAALNSRGQFFSADKPDDLNKAFVSILSSIQANSSRASAPAQSSSKLTTDTVIYQAGFNTLDWTGTLTAYQLNSTTGAIASSLWEASEVLPAHGSRNILTWKPSTGGVAFQWANLSTDQQAALGGLSTLVSYLRGDATMEGTWRRRSSKLGDIINSDPVFVAAADYGYEALPSGTPGADTYRTFVNGTKRTRTKMLFVGANDGMLHGFRASDGRELLAFIPNEAIVNQGLANLKDPTYSHRYYVDGSPFAGDAYLNSAWKTVLVSGMGAGGKAVFALDVTDPDNFAAGNVMWEYTDAADLGYTFGQPIIVRLNNGEWAVVFGNGVNSANHRAVLYVVNLADGTLIKKIDTGVGDATTQNGLSTPVGYDSNQDRVTDLFYAGDLRGNVWKFDLSSADPADWGIAYDDGQPTPSPVPLFRARNASGQVQPITAPLELGRAPGGQSGGLMVYFGTGRFLATGDNVVAGAQTQSFYGIYDNGTAIAATNRSTLQQQTILTATTSFGFEVRVTSDNPVDYASQRGWYMDLTATGERVVSAPLLRHGRVVFVTLIPSADPCNFGGDSWLMEVNAENGDRPDASVFDFTGEGQFTSADYVTYSGDSVPISGLKSPVGIIDTPAVVTKDTSEIKIGFGARPDAAGNTSFSIGEAGGLGRSGRVSWREIID
ncbi:MAG TPA: PilC/PilY family type IV pilus protein [Thiobacillaceae bacterium]|nr:PilC/PilY family type IV pilus protein [Thiobacillaceae bacterium]